MSFVPFCAVRGVIFTVDPTETGWAGAGVAVNAVCAVGSVPTRVALALVDVLLTLWTPEARQAGAQEAVHLVLTKASIAAGVCERGVSHLAVSSQFCVYAIIHKIDLASSVNKLTWLAVVNIGLTIAACEARFAATAVAA